MTSYSPFGQPGGYSTYASLTDLLSEGFDFDTPVEVDDGLDIITTTIGELTEANLPAGNLHPRDKRRAEALTLLAGVFKAREFGDDGLTEDATDLVLTFVQHLFVITIPEIDAEMRA
jgi:hypothetical protein